MSFSVRLAQEAKKATYDNAFVKIIVNGFEIEVTNVSVVNVTDESHGGIDAKTRDGRVVLINVDAIDGLIFPSEAKPYSPLWGDDQPL